MMGVAKVLCCLVVSAAAAPGSMLGGGEKIRRRFSISHFNALLGIESGSNATTHFYAHATKDHAASVYSPGGTFRQRFYVDTTFWTADGPIFLYIGGEGPQGPVSSNAFLYAEAEKHGALMLALEQVLSALLLSVHLSSELNRLVG